MNKIIITMVLGLMVSCAGRAPTLTPTVQLQDQTADCTAIRAEITSNNERMADLSREEGGKVAQNIAAGVAGVLIWPLWFAMDFQDAAGKEGKSLQQRNQYLATVAADRCAAPPPVAQPVAAAAS